MLINYSIKQSLIVETSTLKSVLYDNQQWTVFFYYMKLEEDLLIIPS